MQINTAMYNELTTEINIPGILVAEKNAQGTILQTQLCLHNKAVRSGLHIQFQHQVQSIQKYAQINTTTPLLLFINGESRKVLPLEKDVVANQQLGIVLLPHCFMSQENLFAMSNRFAYCIIVTVSVAVKAL